MKLLASFSKAEEAHLLRARLEGSGIAAYVRDENMVSLDWFASNAVGGVKVDVADEDFPAALAVFREEQHEPAAPVAAAVRSGPALLGLFLLTALVVFVIVAVRNQAIAYPREYAVPAAFGLVAGSLAVVLARLGRRVR